MNQHTADTVRKDIIGCFEKYILHNISSLFIWSCSQLRLQYIRKALYRLCQRFCGIKDRLVALIFHGFSANLKRISKCIWIGTKTIVQCPFCGGGFRNYLAGTECINAPCDIQHPAECVEAASGGMCVFSNRFIVAFHIDIQFLKSRIAQFVSDILSVQKNTAFHLYSFPCLIA